ncbi:MAG: cyanophycinase [Pseudomonadota bacterium]
MSPSQNNVASSIHKKSGKKEGKLIVIGGGEDKKFDKEILSHFVKLSGGSKANIVVITAASSVQDEVWETYQEVFKELDVEKCLKIALYTREDANNPEIAQLVLEANGIFMTGGDQKKLMALIGGTAVDIALHKAFTEHGACIAGTSAGASAMSGHMLAQSSGEKMPTKGTVHLGAGLGFLHRVVIDQHFSERQRLGRLLAVIAQNPYLLGVGIDEDTALVVTKGKSFEIIGNGAMTVVDGREMISNFNEISAEERLELTNMKLHLFPSGTRHYFDEYKDIPESATTSSLLHEVISIITSSNEHRA